MKSFLPISEKKDENKKHLHDTKEITTIFLVDKKGSNGNKRRIIMPQNKRESMIYTVLMCFVMVFWKRSLSYVVHRRPC